MLAGLRVLDLSRLLPGPYCTRVLADAGAEVIKIEPPEGGDWARMIPPLNRQSGESELFRDLNRGKKSLTLNLKSKDGRAILLQLVKGADVLLESFRPGVMTRLSLDYERLAEENAGLVYCSLTGYGARGAYRERAAHDLNCVGLSGLLDLTGPRDGLPVIPGAPISDLMGALWAAVGVLLALFARERTGAGQRVDASMLGGVLACLPLAFAQHQGGGVMVRGADYLTGGAVCYNIYETKDGRQVTLAALEPHFWVSFCQAVGKKEWINQQLAPAANGEPVYEELCALFRSRTRSEWMEALSFVDACCEPVYTLAEALDSAPVRALGMIVDGAMLSPIQLSAQPARPPTSAPALGQHTDALLLELGYDAATISALRMRRVV